MYVNIKFNPFPCSRSISVTGLLQAELQPTKTVSLLNSINAGADLSYVHKSVKPLKKFSSCIFNEFPDSFMTRLLKYVYILRDISYVMKIH